MKTKSPAMNLSAGEEDGRISPTPVWNRGLEKVVWFAIAYNFYRTLDMSGTQGRQVQKKKK